LPTKTPVEQDKELRQSKKMLEDLLGHEISVIAYPYGDYNAAVEALAKSIGYKYGLSFNRQPMIDTGDVFAIDRIGVWPGMDVVKYLQNLNQ
jgi:peptidoglycan/xylan/chitin deacetylase (PgdA/CDA1 family)